MDFVQAVRVLVFGFLTQLPIFMTMWSLTVLPEILKLNYGVEGAGRRSVVAGYFYSSFFYGIIIGSFIWPHVLNHISKRNALFIAMALQGILTALTGMSDSLYYLYAMRLLCGLMHNINTVGKDFIFEFCNDKYRQRAFSFKSCFSILASFAGPFVGYHIYMHTGKSFAQSCVIIAGVYLIALTLFLVFFYLIKSDLNATRSVISVEDEETHKLTNGKVKKQIGLKETVKYCIENRELRAFMLVYLITNGVFKTINVITVFYLEAPFSEEGLGVDSMTLTYISLLSYLPCVIVLLSAPSFVPKKLGYRPYIMMVLSLFSLAILMLPVFKDIMTPANYQKFIWFVYLNQVLLYFANPKLFSPAINYLVGKSVSRRMRASANAVTFIGSTLASALLLNIIAPLYSMSIENEYLMKFDPYGKYLAFVILAMLIWLCIYLLREHKKTS